MTPAEEPVTILCVEDNAEVAAALQTKLSRVGGFRWVGTFHDASDLAERTVVLSPRIVLLDVDMPGPDPFVSLEQLTARCPEARAVMFTGHVRRDLVERALEAGAWGYVSKNDGEEELVAVLRAVAGGEFALGPEARRLYDSAPGPGAPDETTRVLVVDDATDLADLYRALIDAEGDMACPGVLHSADDLVALARETRPHVVLLDLSMPGRPPLDAARELAALDPSTRVVVFSGYDDDRTVDEVLEAGAWGLISKHASPPEVVEAIRRVARGEISLPRSR